MNALSRPISEREKRPESRIVGALALCCVLFSPFSAAAQPANPDFRTFLESLWPKAQARGVTRATFDSALNGLQPDTEAMALTRRQPEYGKAVGAYLGGMVAQARIQGGVRRLTDWRDTLDAVEQKFGVDREIIVAIWGIETGFGANPGSKSVIRSLASTSFARYKGDLFQGELIDALLILQQGDVPRERMIGSWAGAMGQPQFIPSSYQKWAVDFSGDGKRDIWSNVPDVFGSIANYLKGHGWKAGLPWGFEVSIPRQFDFRRSRASFADWTALGLRRADGRAFPAQGEGILFFPSGIRGPAFLVTENFNVLKTYNTSDVYALAIGHLADRLRGGVPIAGRWPDDDLQLSREARQRMQKRIAELGYKVSNFEGLIDFELRDAIRDIQTKAGQVPDGYPGPVFLATLFGEQGGARRRVR
jgi:membrane-bound lytic murein transglycosylase B